MFGWVLNSTFTVHVRLVNIINDFLNINVHEYDAYVHVDTCSCTYTKQMMCNEIDACIT